MQGPPEGVRQDYIRSESNFGAGRRANNLAAHHPKEDKQNNGKYKGGND